MFKSFAVSTFILLLASLIEAAILSNITVLPAVPDLCLLCVMYFSLQNGRLMGETTGFVSGLFLDFLSSGVMGLNCLVRTIIGFVSGLFTKVIITEGFFVPLLLGFCATLMKGFILWLLSILYPTEIMKYNPISWLFLFELIANSILTPIIFRLLDVFKKTLVLKPETVE